MVQLEGGAEDRESDGQFVIGRLRFVWVRQQPGLPFCVRGTLVMGFEQFVNVWEVAPFRAWLILGDGW